MASTIAPLAEALMLGYSPLCPVALYGKDQDLLGDTPKL